VIGLKEEPITCPKLEKTEIRRLDPDEIRLIRSFYGIRREIMRKFWSEEENQREFYKPLT
jgi:hypothetical protein